MRPSAELISTVTKEEIHGQEINRLLQLLVEGHGTASGIPLVDSLTLSRATERVDLVSTKKCEILRLRSNQVEKFMFKEVEHLVQNLQEDEDTKQLLLICPKERKWRATKSARFSMRTILTAVVMLATHNKSIHFFQLPGEMLASPPEKHQRR
jgi:hypothetical protein